jgi:hypothetical protein
MKLCTQCYYAKRTTLTEWFELVWTCLHPLSRTPVGRALSCNQAREEGKFCGPRGDAFKPQHGSPQSVVSFRN